MVNVFGMTYSPINRPTLTTFRLVSVLVRWTLRHRHQLDRPRPQIGPTTAKLRLELVAPLTKNTGPQSAIVNLWRQNRDAWLAFH